MNYKYLLFIIILIILILFLLYLSREPFVVYKFVHVTAKVGNILHSGSNTDIKDVSDIPNDHYVSSTYSVGNRFSEGYDLETTQNQKCNDNQFIKTPLIPGDAVTLGSPGVCEELEICDAVLEYEKNKPQEAPNPINGKYISDRICADKSACTDFDIFNNNTGKCEPLGEFSININLTNNIDIKIKTKTKNDTIKTNTVFLTRTQIEYYFKNLNTIDSNFSDTIQIVTKLMFGLDKTTKSILGIELDCYYNKFINLYSNDDSQEYISYLLDLKNQKVKNTIIKTHLYLDTSFIERLISSGIIEDDEPLYLFIFGTTVSSGIPMKVFNAENVIFALIYRPKEYKNTTNYNFDIVKYNLDLFYEYNKKFAIAKTLSSASRRQYFDNYLNSIIFNNNSITYTSQLYNKVKDDLYMDINVKYNNKTYSVIQSMKTINQCNFTPIGETIYECKNKCNKFNNCATIDCKILCENCNSNDCLWNIKNNINIDLLSPDIVTVKGFSGNKIIKLSWIKPHSPSEIKRYYVILTSPIDAYMLYIYSFYDNRELCEYIIPNLNNDYPYDIYVITKNQIGVSKMSNKVTIVPNINSNLKYNDSNDSYSNSIENYYKQQKGDGFDLKKQKSLYERNSTIQDLKNIIRNDLKINIPTESYNINIY